MSLVALHVGRGLTHYVQFSVIILVIFAPDTVTTCFENLEVQGNLMALIINQGIE